MIGFILLLGFIAFIAAVLVIRHTYLVPSESNSGLCPSCGYAVVGLPSNAPCPECGTPAAAFEGLRQGARFARRDTVLRVAWLVAIAYLVNMIVGMWPSKQWWVIASPLSWGFTAVPYLVLFFTLTRLTRGLTPQAAAMLAMIGLLGITPLITIVDFQAIVLPPEPGNLWGLVVFGAPLVSIASAGYGLLLGSLIVQIPWFKQSRAAALS